MIPPKHRRMPAYGTSDRPNSDLIHSSVVPTLLIRIEVNGTIHA